MKIIIVEYLNTEKIPIKVANQVASNCDDMVADSCNHNINNKYKNEYKKINKFKREGLYLIGWNIQKYVKVVMQVQKSKQKCKKQ